ncbi:MAG: radical SAM protein [Patescibacteria group bacterium]
MGKMKEISCGIYESYGSCHIRFSGGEPFVCPDFIQFLRVLSEYHTLEVSTNLSADVNNLKERLCPEGLLLSSSFHPQFIDIHEFLKKVLFLKNSGFDISVTFVAYPPFLAQLKYYRETIENNGIQFIIQLFSGAFNGLRYPESYTDEEKMLLKEQAGLSLHKDANKQIYESKMDIGRIHARICRMGQMYAKIDNNGDVFRCCASGSPKLGNIFNGGLQLLDKPQACEINPCPCWKAMIVGEEEVWLKNWEYQKHRKEGNSIEGGGNLESSLNIKETIPRESIPPHRVFFTWDIHYRCNYRCTYCNAPKPGQGGFIEARYLPIDKWLAIWGDIYERYGRCQIQLSGGEPFIYPGAMDLVIQLSKIHTLEFSTNFYWDIEPFIQNVSPDRARIGVSFHPEFADFGSFLDKALRLKRNGFEVWVNYVAYPALLKDMPGYKLEIERAGMHFSILPFTGQFEGRVFPGGYTEREMMVINEGYVAADEVNKKTIDWNMGEQKNKTKGKLCRMGQMYGKIRPNGLVHRCCGTPASELGNIIDGTFKLSEEPLACESEQCPCWRCMLVSDEGQWSTHWVIPHKR